MLKSNAEFVNASNAFLVGAQAIIDADFAKNYPNSKAPSLIFGGGSKYLRVERVGPGERSVHCFLNMENGDVLKAAGWKAPAKGARGNIYNEDRGLGRMGVYGPAYNN